MDELCGTHGGTDRLLLLCMEAAGHGDTGLGTSARCRSATASLHRTCREWESRTHPTDPTARKP